MLILLLAVMVLCYAFQALFCKFYSQKCTGDTAVISLIFAVIFGCFIRTATLALGGFTFSPSPLTLAFGLLNAAVLVVFHLSQIGAAARGSYAIMNLCMLFGGIIVPMIVSAIKLGQHLSTLQIIAVVLMFVAFILLNCQGVSLGGTKKGYWFMCAALALSNGTYGAFMSLQAGLLDGAERTEMIAVSYIGSALLAAAAAAILGLRVKRDRKNPDVKDAPPTLHISCAAVGWAIACCIVATAAANILLYLLSKMNTTVVNTVDNGGVLLLSALFAFIFFGERPSKLQYCGLAAALVSIILLG